MAISFTCPFCNEAYNNLKDELIGKRVTCRNTACRKIFVVKPNVPVGVAAPSAETGNAVGTGNSGTSTPALPPKPAARPPIRPAPIPKPNGPTPPLDAEAMALAAFAEEPKKVEAEVQKIKVTCTICDHQFEVDRTMEGRNVPCPECRKLVKVPLLKKEEPVDWRKQENRDHLKKNEPVLEGVSEKKNVSAEALLSAGAVPQIQFEPLPLATKLKRLLVLLILLGGATAGTLFLLKSRNQKTENKSIAEAIKLFDTDAEVKGRTDLQAGIHRLAAEERLRTTKTRADLDEAVKFLNIARDRAGKGSDNLVDRQAELVEIAVTYCSLGGDAKQLDAGLRLKWDDVQKQVRQTLERVTDPELRLYGLHRCAQRLTEHHEAWRALDVAKQIVGPGELPEIAGQVGLEMVKAKQNDAAKEFLKNKVVSMLSPASVKTAPSLTALRVALGSPDEPLQLNNLPLVDRPSAAGMSDESRLAWAEALAFAGEFKTAADIAARPGQPDRRVRALLSVGDKALLDNNREAALPALEAARVAIVREGKAPTISPWLKVRTIYLLARAGKPEPAGELADALDKEFQTWARVELLRGRLQSAPNEPAQEEWLPPVLENTKPRLAHAVARELFARHQSALGLAGPADELPAATRPFAQLGALLGGETLIGRESGIGNRESGAKDGR